MCNKVLKTGLICKIKSKSNFCHIHKKYEIDEYKKQEIINLNSTINKKCQIISNLKNIQKENLSFKLKNNNLNIENNELNIENEKLKNELLKYKDDYNKYQIIKEFEIRKNNLIKKGIDIYNYKDKDFHNLRYKRNEVAHLIY